MQSEIYNILHIEAPGSHQTLVLSLSGSRKRAVGGENVAAGERGLS
jgi:hypothetical protein